MHVADMLGFGGREKITIDLANALSENNHQVQFVTLSNNLNEQALCLKKTIQLFELPCRYNKLEGINAIGFWIKCLPAFIKLLKKEKPDIVHTHLFFQRLLFVAIAIKLCGIKIRHYHTIHTSGLFYKEKGTVNSIRLRTEKIAVKLNKAFLIAISEEVYKNTVSHFKKESSGIALIYNGVDDKQFDYRLKNTINKSLFGFTDDDIVVTYVARITEGKDHLTLLKAWKLVSSQISNAKLCLAGDGELKTAMQEFCKKENIDSNVIFLGTVKNVPELLAITDIGVFTSLFEGFGIAVVEQMLMKIPVIATDIKPVNEFIIPEKNGFLFRPGDIESLIDLTVQLINDNALCKRIGEAAYVTAQKFSIHEMTQKHEEIYVIA
jgi:glycosyltransferase involved in cell wall biosynthesis